MNGDYQYDLYGAAFKADVFATYARMRREAPVCPHPGITGRDRIWFVTRHADAAAILLDHRRFIKVPPDRRDKQLGADLQDAPEALRPLTHHLLNMDPPDHTRLRALVNRAFTPRLVEHRREQIQALADSLIDQVQSTRHMELIDDYAFPFSIGVILNILGIAFDDRHSLREWGEVFISPLLSYVQTSQLSQAFTVYLQQLFEQRRGDPRDDLLSALLQAEEEGDKLDEAELIGMVALLIVAGFETTRNLIGNATLALLEHPEQLALLRSQPHRMAEAVEELTRYDPPLERSLIRYAAEDVVLDGQTIHRGDAVIAVLAAANRDPDQFDDPDRLDIDRERSRHLGFGLGIHYCVGAPLARLEGEIGLNTLLGRLPGLRLAVPRADLRWNLSPFLRGLRALPVAWD